MPCEISGGCEKSIDKNKGKAFVDEKHIGSAHLSLDLRATDVVLTKEKLRSFRGSAHLSLEVRATTVISSFETLY